MENYCYIYDREGEVYAYRELSDYFKELAADYRDNVPEYVLVASVFDSNGKPEHLSWDDMQDRYQEWRNDDTQ